MRKGHDGKALYALPSGALAQALVGAEIRATGKAVAVKPDNRDFRSDDDDAAVVADFKKREQQMLKTQEPIQ